MYFRRGRNSRAHCRTCALFSETSGENERKIKLPAGLSRVLETIRQANTGEMQKSFDAGRKRSLFNSRTQRETKRGSGEKGGKDSISTLDLPTGWAEKAESGSTFREKGRGTFIDELFKFEQRRWELVLSEMNFLIQLTFILINKFVCVTQSISSIWNN